MFNLTAQKTMAFLAKYNLTILFIWLGTFLSGFFGDSSPLKITSLVVGIILGLVTIAAKVLEMVQKYQKDTVREQIRELIKQDKFDEDEKEKLNEIINE